jgi:hypothetical protein
VGREQGDDSFHFNLLLTFSQNQELITSPSMNKQEEAENSALKAGEKEINYQLSAREN